MIKENATVYGTVTKETFVLQMSSPGFGWLDLLSADDRADIQRLTERGEKAKKNSGGDNFQVIRRVEVETVEVPWTTFSPVYK